MFRRNTLVIAHATCVFSHTVKKEHRDWCIKDASCSVYPWACSVTSRPFMVWVYALIDYKKKLPTTRRDMNIPTQNPNKIMLILDKVMIELKLHEMSIPCMMATAWMEKIDVYKCFNYWYLFVFWTKITCHLKYVPSRVHHEKSVCFPM